MKKAIFIAALATSYFLSGNTAYVKTLLKPKESPTLLYEQVPQELPINVLLWQDVSGSISKNGVELIQSSVFYPYFDDLHRDIQLHFGIINGSTAHKLIALELPKAQFRKPMRPDLRLLSITDKDAIEKEYAKTFSAYEQDSARFFNVRVKRFQKFCSQVDMALAPYRAKLSGSTDLIPAFDIADKVFNFSFAGPQNYMLINSDGLDSDHRTPRQLKNKATIILINANGLSHTSIDAVVSKTMQSVEQAVEFTISNHN